MSQRTLIIEAFVGLLAVSFGSRLMDQQLVADDSSQRQHAGDVLELLSRYCGDCHQGDSAESGVNFDLLDPAVASTSDRPTWIKILRQLDNHLMPPADSLQPADAERKRLVEWIKVQAITVQCNGPAYPGRVTLRRLNSDQYNRTIRDLIGVDFRPADSFPSDDVGYGFDNIGDVLSLPPVLMERYLEAADEIVRRAIIVPDRNALPLVSWPGELLTSADGAVGGEVSIAIDGEYLLRVQAHADQAGREVSKMAILLNDHQLEIVEVTATENKPGTFEIQFPAQPGSHQLAVRFANDYYEPNHPDPALRGDRNLNISWVELIGPIGVRTENLPQSHVKLLANQPAPDASSAEILSAVRSNLRTLLPRALRRPSNTAELERYVRVAEMVLNDGLDFARAMQVAVQAILVSPAFLFRLETDPADATAQERELSDYELASRLSYFLWNSLPDDQLYRLASAGKLRNDGQLRQQVQSMLADSRSFGFVHSFTSQWLQLRKLEASTMDQQRYPRFDDELRSSMQQETVLLVETIIHENRSLFDLLTADFTFVNEALSELYGIDDVQGQQLQRVSLAGRDRRGLLGHASFLTVTSNPTRTSPVKRGRWILDNLLGMPPPPPPPDVPVLEAAESAQEKPVSLRAQMELHRQKPECATCHQLMDPLGFGLENFDAIGAWRDEENGQPIDSSGELPDDGSQFSGPQELVEVLIQRKAAFRRCLASKLLTYALGRGLEYFDECTLNEVTESVESGGDSLSLMIECIVLSRPFRMQAKTSFPP